MFRGAEHNNNNRIQRHNSRLFTISSLLCEMSPAPMLKWPGRSGVQITCNISSTYHVQYVFHAMWYEGTAQLLSQSLNRIYFSFIKLAEPLDQ